MEYVQEELPHLKLKWLRSIQEFLAFIYAGLQLDEPGVAPLERIHDKL
jgi:hypothetical protein